MRTRRVIDVLLPPTRRAVLAAFLMNPDRRWYVRQLARHIDIAPSSLQAELRALTEAGILRRHAEGRQVYFQADTRCPVFPELQRLIVKTAGLVDVLRKLLAPLRSRIDTAFVYGSIARGEEISASDVDLMVIGSVGLAGLSSSLQDAGRQLGRPVNPTVMSRDELQANAGAGRPFIRSVLNGAKLFVFGGQDELERLVGRTAGRASTDRQGRDRRSP